MGVKGLASWTRSNCTARRIDLVGVVQDELARPTLVFDAIGLAFYLYKSSKVHWLFGGDYADFRIEIQNYFDVLVSSGIQCIVCFDGHSSPTKQNCTKSRRDSDLVRISAIKRRLWTIGEQNTALDLSELVETVEQGNSGSIVCPLLLCECLKETLHTFFAATVEVQVAQYEADELIVSVARNLMRDPGSQSPTVVIVTNDSDFLVYPDIPNVVFFWDLMVSKPAYTGGRNTVVARAYSPSQLAATMGLPGWGISLVASFCGNDSSDSAATDRLQGLLKASGKGGKKLSRSHAKCIPAGQWVEAGAHAVRYCCNLKGVVNPRQCIAQLVRLLGSPSQTSKSRAKQKSRKATDQVQEVLERFAKEYLEVPVLVGKQLKEYNLAEVVLQNSTYLWPRPFFEHWMDPWPGTVTFDQTCASKPTSIMHLLRKPVSQLLRLMCTKHSHSANAIQVFGVKENRKSWASYTCKISADTHTEPTLRSLPSSSTLPNAEGSLHHEMSKVSLEEEQANGTQNYELFHYLSEAFGDIGRSQKIPSNGCPLSPEELETLSVALKCVSNVCLRAGVPLLTVRKLCTGVYCSIHPDHTTIPEQLAGKYSSVNMAECMAISGVFAAVLYLVNQFIDVIGTELCSPKLSSEVYHGTTIARVFHCDLAHLAEVIGSQELEVWLDATATTFHTAK